MLRAWAQGRSLDTKRRRAEDFLPLAVRDELPGLFDELDALARVHSAHAGDDGSTRLLVALADGQIQSTSLSSVQQAVASRPHATLGPDGSLGMVAWVDNGDSMAYSASYTPAGGWAHPLHWGLRCGIRRSCWAAARAPMPAPSG